MEKALNIAHASMEEEMLQVKALKHYFNERITASIPEVTFNGHSNCSEKSTYTLVNICLPVPPEKAAMLLFQLDLKGIACSKGSACQSGSSQKSHVLSEILNDADLEKPSFRFSFSIFNSKAEIDYVIDVLKTFCNALD